MKFNEITSLNEFASFLKVPKRKLTYILYIKGIDNCYYPFEIKKKSGGVRKINAPDKDLKNIQQELAKALYIFKSQWDKNNIVSHGFEKNKTIITNAKIHRNKKIVFNIDLENFFESFHFGRVRGYFMKNKHFNLPEKIATIIAQLTCYKGKLPQGAPTSPVITNLIFEILDNRIKKICKIYKLDYTRYADDLTFSTNDKLFLEKQLDFYEVLSKEIEAAGFKINEGKNRLQLKNSRQLVTGLVVNQKVNINRKYYRETRAMAHHLYKEGEFTINGEAGTLNQLEGRFSFINQITWYNNKNDNDQHSFFKLSQMEKEFSKFLTYRYFFANSKPLIVTEGKTDIDYLKGALKNNYKKYPNLIIKKDNGSFDFKVSFLSKSKRLEYLLNLTQDGGDGLKYIYDFYGKNKKNNYMNYFREVSGTEPKHPVILVFDNETESDKPLRKFLNHTNMSQCKNSLITSGTIRVIDNLYVLTVPLVKGMTECEIEDLFDEKTLKHQIDGKTFSRNKKLKTGEYGKGVFAKFISNNYQSIDFSGFEVVLDNLNRLVTQFNEEK